MKKVFVTASLLMLLAGVGIMWFAKAQESGIQEQKPVYYANTVTSPPLPATLSFAGEKVLLDKYWVYEALDRELIINCYQHSKTLRIFKLSSRIFPVIEQILKEEGVPDDFKYLCVAESGLENVTSPASAVGYWQFIPATARKYGLEVSDEIDERCNLEKSTKAACRYLKTCKAQFGSWVLAAAAYNRGEGGLQRALSSQQTDNYWDLWLNSETSRYVFRIIAFKLIFENPQAYGIQICPAEMYQPVLCRDSVVTASILDLPAFARQMNVTYREIRDLNPWIKSPRLLVAGGKSYTLKIPDTTKGAFRTRLQQINNPYMLIGNRFPESTKQNP